jgi:hypothetical protein
METTTTKLPEVIQTWVDDLRSGKYKQGKGALKDYCNGDHFCCLGVLTEQYVNATGDSYYDEDKVSEVDWEDTYEFPGDDVNLWLIKETSLPYSLYNLLTGVELSKIDAYKNNLGIDVVSLRIHLFTHSSEVASFLASLNDAGVSFSQIASIIEYIYTEIIPKRNVNL